MGPATEGEEWARTGAHLEAMQLVTFETGTHRRVGVWDDPWIFDLSQVGLPATMIEFIALGAEGIERARKALASDNIKARIDSGSARVLAPIPRPARNLFAIGMNYRDHLAELQAHGFSAKEPEYPVVFTKATSTVIGPGDTILASLDPTDSVDYEGELGVVIGRAPRGLSKADAMSAVYGYTIVNDVSSRTLQTRHNQFFLGKSLDTFCPLGPYITTADEIADPSALRIVTKVNGETRQNGTVADLIFDIPALIETLAATMTLEPGDVIATGTPAGVGLSFKPPKYLHPGDRVSVEIDGLGILENPVG